MVDKQNLDHIDDDKELEELFEQAKNKKLSKAIKKAKRLSTLKMILISGLTFIILAIATQNIGIEIINNRWMEYIDKTSSRYIVQAPNKFPGYFSTYMTPFSGRTEHATFKYINDKRVFTGTYGIEYNWLSEIYVQGTGRFISETDKTDEEINYLPRYNKVGQKQMVFYYPYVDYGDWYEKDLDLLQDIGNDKYMEIALSFDKAYSIDEVNQMIPESINLTWYWVDAVKKSHKETQKYYINEQENGMKVAQYPDLCYEENAYGFKSINEYGEKVKKPEEAFIEALIYGGIDHIYNIIAGEDNELTREDIDIQGVVVTGDAENLKVLRQLDFIKGSSLGVIVDKY